MTGITLSFRGLLAGLAIGITGIAAHAQPRYTIAEIPGLPENTTFVTNLNDRGDIVGNYGSGPTGFVLRNGVATSVGKLPGGLYSYASAINNLGVVVGDGDMGSVRPQSWVTSGSGLINFFPNNGGNTHALFISDSGFIGGYYTKSLSGWMSSWKAAVWFPNSKKADRWDVVDLPVPAGGINPKATTAFPFGFNQGGQAVGYYQNDLIGGRACFWDNNAARTLVVLDQSPDYGNSCANAINDSGQAAGEVHPPFGSLPIFWNNDAKHTATLLALPPGDNYGGAIKVNNLGHVLGYSAYGEPGTWNIGPSRPVLWRDGAVYTVQSLLDSTTGVGWTVTSAIGLNNKGQILGVGIHNGQERAFLLTPTP